MNETTGDKQILSKLRSCALFAALDDAELRKVAAFTTEKQYEAGTTLFKEGDKAEELLVVQEGKIALQMILPEELTQISRRITVDVATQNEIAGWSTIVEPYVYSFTAVCLQNVKALSVNAIKLRQLLQDNRNVGYEILKELVKVIASRLDETRQVLISERFLVPR